MTIAQNTPCLFCDIITGKLSATIIYQDDQVIAFDDIHPQAPEHKIIIPRKHIATLNELEPADAGVLSHLTQTGITLAKQLGIDQSGYRLLMNCNADGGQTVFHIHLHLLGGRHLSWPPG